MDNHARVNMLKITTRNIGANVERVKCYHTQTKRESEAIIFPITAKVPC